MAEPLQSALGDYNALAYGEGAFATVTIGLTPEQIAPLLQAAGAAAQAQITELSSQLNVSRDVVLGFLRTLREDEVSIENLASKLNEIANRYLGLMERLSALDPEDAVARALIEQAHQVLQNASSATDYDRAESLLQRASSSQWQSIRRVEEFEREAHEAARRLRRDNAATLAEMAELSLTRLDYLQAAQHFRSAADLVAPEDVEHRLNYILRSATALEYNGETRGDSYSFECAILEYRKILHDLSLRESPRMWCLVQLMLGKALREYGMQSMSASLLDEAIVACNSSMENLSTICGTATYAPAEKYKPLFYTSWSSNVNFADSQIMHLWGAANEELGKVLRSVGMLHNSSKHLDDAVSLHRLITKSASKIHLPIAWAGTQVSLGNSLAALGFSQKNIEPLEEAMKAYQSALVVFSRDKEPNEWANVQNNMAVASWYSYLVNSDVSNLEYGVKAAHLALSQWNRERELMDWSLAQVNLSNILVSLGEAKEHDDCIGEAVRICRSVLEALQHNHNVSGYIQAQDSLANALWALGRKGEGVQVLREARSSTQAAMNSITQANLHHVSNAYANRLAAIDALIVSRSSFFRVT